MQRAEYLDTQVVADRAVLECQADKQTGPGEVFKEGRDSEQAPSSSEKTTTSSTQAKKCPKPF